MSRATLEAKMKRSSVRDVDGLSKSEVRLRVGRRRATLEEKHEEERLSSAVYHATER